MSKNKVLGMGFPYAISTFTKCMGNPPMAKLLAGSRSPNNIAGSIFLSNEVACIDISCISLGW